MLVAVGWVISQPGTASFYPEDIFGPRHLALALDAYFVRPRLVGERRANVAITSELVRLMQGKLWVESKPNEGSTFRFTLPISVPE